MVEECRKQLDMAYPLGLKVGTEEHFFSLENNNTENDEFK